jgi:hypothetical protein
MFFSIYAYSSRLHLHPLYSLISSIAKVLIVTDFHDMALCAKNAKYRKQKPQSSVKGRLRLSYFQKCSGNVRNGSAAIACIATEVENECFAVCWP